MKTVVSKLAVSHQARIKENAAAKKTEEASLGFVKTTKTKPCKSCGTGTKKCYRFGTETKYYFCHRKGKQQLLSLFDCTF